jgi:hypothetical protein
MLHIKPVLWRCSKGAAVTSSCSKPSNTARGRPIGRWPGAAAGKLAVVWAACPAATAKIARGRGLSLCEPVFCCFYQADEQGVGPHGPRKEFRMELAANHVGMIGQLCDFHELSIGGKS